MGSPLPPEPAEPAAPWWQGQGGRPLLTSGFPEQEPPGAQRPCQVMRPAFPGTPLVRGQARFTLASWAAGCHARSCLMPRARSLSAGASRSALATPGGGRES